jgi:diguanylate cyclase (GGDEF)-like protein/PAS domain S-box-containing protein
MQPTSRLLKETLELSRDAVCIIACSETGSDARIVYVNRAFEVMTGYGREDILGCHPGFLQGEKTAVTVVEAIDSAICAGEFFQGESWYYRKDGEPFLVSWVVHPVINSDAAAKHVVVLHRDVTEQRKRRRRRQDLEKVVGLQREVVTGKLDLQRVRQRVVDAALQISGADAAVIEETEGGDLVYRAVAGRADGNLGLRLPVGDSLSVLSYRSRELMICADTQSDSRVVLKEDALRIGFVSGILVPLLHEKQCYGVLKVYAARPDAFASEDCQLLEIASGILAAALFNAASFEQEVNRRSMLIDAIPLLVSYIDRARRYQEVNAAYEDWFGIDANDIRGKFMWEVLGQPAYEKIRPHLDAAFAGEEVSYEAEVPYRKGGTRSVLAQYQPNRNGNDVVLGVYAVVRDLTPVRQAETDFLTGLLNRRKVEEEAKHLLRNVERHGQDLSLILLDVDNFKRINDRFGHLVGDQVLRDVGGHLGKTVRGMDIVGRWGGEEFIVIAPETAMEEARLLAERICSEIRTRTFDEVQNVSFSAGVAQARREEALDQLLERTDAALYRAKREGRDRVVVAEGC